MSQYDFIILGATGFTGKWVVEEARKTGYNFGIAGRNKSNLEKLHSNILVCDINEDSSILNMVSQCKLLINCTGPYRLLGERVLSACVKSGTDYIDICGEPAFIEEMELKYFEEARLNKCLIVSACGFDSIPSEIGVVMIQNYFYEKNLKLDGIEAFLTFPKMHRDYHGHATTWDCAVMGFANQSELRKIRKGLNLAPLDSRGLKRRKFLSNVDGVPGIHGRVIPFPGSDSSIVRRSQSYLTRTESKITPVRFTIYCLIERTSSVLKLIIGGLIFGILTKFSLGQNLLTKFAEIFSFGWFSRAGPSMEAVQNSNFEIKFRACGSDNNGEKVTKIASVSGPEIGYDSTSKILISCVDTLISERSKILAETKGGIFTSASIFRNTQLLKKLSDKKIDFKIESSQ